MRAVMALVGFIVLRMLFIVMLVLATSTLLAPLSTFELAREPGPRELGLALPGFLGN